MEPDNHEQMGDEMGILPLTMPGLHPARVWFHHAGLDQTTAAKTISQGRETASRGVDGAQS